jgi:hypothetical protein
MVDLPPDTPDTPHIPDPADTIQAQIAELAREVEKLQKRLMSLCTELALMEDEAASICRNLWATRRYRKRAKPDEL